MGVEVGVATGVHSESILKCLPIEKLFLVDPYLPYADHSGVLFGTQTDYEEAKERLKPYGNRVVWLLKKSVEAIDDIPNELDFVYLDGDHSYETVKWEINAFYPKIRVGGVLGGHNFQLRWTGVCRAACEFVEGRDDIECFSLWFDWWFVKKSS